MVEVIVVIREVNSLKPEYYLQFDLPRVPAIGEYISIHRPDLPDPYSEDMIVRCVWWRLNHPETRASVSGDEKLKTGSVEEIFVECEQAVGPLSADRWRDRLTGRAPALEVARLSIRQDEMKAGDE